MAHNPDCHWSRWPWEPRYLLFLFPTDVTGDVGGARSMGLFWQRQAEKQGLKVRILRNKDDERLHGHTLVFATTHITVQVQQCCFILQSGKPYNYLWLFSGHVEQWFEIRSRRPLASIFLTTRQIASKLSRLPMKKAGYFSALFWPGQPQLVRQVIHLIGMPRNFYWHLVVLLPSFKKASRQNTEH